MKLIYKNILMICVCFLNMGAIYGSENKKAYKSIQELSVPKKMTQTDSLALLEQKEKLIATLLEKQEAFELKYFILIGVLLFLVILFGLLCLLNKRGDKRLEKIVSLLEKNQKSDESNSEVAKDNTLDIDPVVIDAILENLKVFEQERGFLNPKITLYEFAKKLQTNTKYLSKVINTYKLKSFRNYINDLRVQYSIERLKQHRDYRNYTMHAMAQEAGFSNRESFSKAFQRKTGESVSDFLKQAPLK